jgi:hypothetical protein
VVRLRLDCQLVGCTLCATLNALCLPSYLFHMCGFCYAMSLHGDSPCGLLTANEKAPRAYSLWSLCRSPQGVTSISIYLLHHTTNLMICQVLLLDYFRFNSQLPTKFIRLGLCQLGFLRERYSNNSSLVI